MGGSMKVTKRSVEVFDVCGQALDREQATEVYVSLGAALGRPQFETKGCGDRYSHGPHVHGGAAQFYCGGRSFDAT